MAHPGSASDGGARCVALVGPYSSGKTTLLEAILLRTGAITRKGTIAGANTYGDTSPEARANEMSVEMNVAEIDFLGNRFTLLDCPGSVEFQHEAEMALSGCDAAVVVCEADPRKVPALHLILKGLEDRGIPHFLFLNKIDKVGTRLRDILPVLQPASGLPLVLRHIPIWENGIATGFVDLALERAYVYREHAPSEVIDIPADLGDREAEARFSMLEQLADYDDRLMEQLLEDIEPPRDLVFDDLAAELREGAICPVLIGSAEHGHGIFRLLKALRHEVPHVERTAARLGLAAAKSALPVLKIVHSAHGGKLALCRVLAGDIADGATVHGRGGDERVSGLYALHGHDPVKRGAARPGDVVALGRVESAAAGDILSTHKPAAGQTALPVTVGIVAAPPIYGLAINARDRKDEVRLTAALDKITDEDGSLRFVQNADVGQMELWGQGEMHLRVALQRLERKYGITAQTRPRRIPYKETIRKSTQARGRHKKQTGGHGQFGDVVIDIRPLPRGAGFAFSEAISGGVVPRQYIPAVEAGVKDYLGEGPLGFPVVDVAVCLTDGSYHSVDSSEQAFRSAGRLAMVEGMPECQPVLLEPVMAVEIAAPSEATPRVNQLVSARRGQLLGFDARPGWPGWDVISAHIPEAQMHDLILELRSVTAGVASFVARFDHLAELSGKLADEVVAGDTAAA
jgi:elongation factor G